MILVTGGTGLVGAHLLYHLSQEDTPVVAIHREGSDLSAVKRVFSYYTNSYEPLFKKITWKIADINDIPNLQEAYINITHVYHCAAVISFSKKDDALLRKVNIRGTANMVNIAIQNNIQKFCFVSSIAAIGGSNKTLVTENNEWNPEYKNNGYAISKFGAEAEVWRASQEGLDVMIVNPGFILGAGFWHQGSGKLFTAVYKGFNYYTEGVTGYVDVIDVVQPMIKLMNSSIKNERFILIAENWSFKDLLFSLADAFKVKRPSIKAHRIHLELAWRFAAVKSFLTQKRAIISKESIRSSNTKTKYSNEKVRTTLNYTFISIADSIKKNCELYTKEI